MSIKIRLLLVAAILLFLTGWPILSDSLSKRGAENPRTAEFASQPTKRHRAPVFLAENRPIKPRINQSDVPDDDTVALDYQLGETRSYLWVVTSSSTRSVELPSRNVIDPMADTLRFALVQSRQPAQRARVDLAANQISDLLLKPAADELTRKRRIAVVLDGSLHEIPFAVLPDPADMRLYLVERHEILVLPSSSTLLASRRPTTRPPPSKILAVLADPVFSPADDRLASHTHRTSSSPIGLPRLLYSAREASAIASLVPGDKSLVALGFKASRELAMSREFGEYKIVHFATHAIQNASDPDRSGIVLSLFDQDGKRLDGVLGVKEIRSLELSADLVVLSACEGSDNLGQEFLAAGARQVLASLWAVTDVSTSRFMSHFYEGLLRDGFTPEQALRQTQLEMIRQPRWNAPANWAGFVLQGDWR